MKLKPFFCFYGGKYRAAPRYPQPIYQTITEPFSGAAGYSTRYYDRKIILNDIDPVIAGLWDYLIHVSSAEILQLPINVSHIDELNVIQEAKSLIGFWLNKGCSAPMKSPSKWYREGLHINSFWGEAIRARIAEQVNYIRHWVVCNHSYDGMISDSETTWFVDPPYNNAAGKHYKHHDLDYEKLSLWCNELHGQVIVCEQAGANWLPFNQQITIRSTSGKNGKTYSKEFIYHDIRKAV